MRRGLLALVASVCAGAGLVACTQLSEFATAHTYGPNFDYIPDDEVDSAMWQMAGYVKRIDALTRNPAASTPSLRARQRMILSRMGRWYEGPSIAEEEATTPVEEAVDEELPRAVASEPIVLEAEESGDSVPVSADPAPLDADEPTSEDPAPVEELPGSVVDPVDSEP